MTSRGAAGVCGDATAALATTAATNDGARRAGSKRIYVKNTRISPWAAEMARVAERRYDLLRAGVPAPA
jgi:hypothetical protein